MRRHRRDPSVRTLGRRTPPWYPTAARSPGAGRRRRERRRWRACGARAFSELATSRRMRGECSRRAAGVDGDRGLPLRCCRRSLSRPVASILDPRMLPLDRLSSIPTISLGHFPTPVDRLDRLRTAIGMPATLLAKRDDAIAFGFGGNKVRKLGIVAADALAAGADTLVTVGGIQSNHARATAATAARLGMRCVIVANGMPQPRPTA